ncbi:MAG: DUF3995 domain-containing protein [Bacteroidota bacterium]
MIHFRDQLWMNANFQPMISTYLIYLVSSILLAISALHFYWALGGQWAVKAVIPEVMEGMFNENHKSRAAFYTLVVAVGLIVLALIIISNLPIISWLSDSWSSLGAKIIGSIFLLRALGDFKWVGFFKKPSESIFARNDTMIYSPLCLFLGIGSWLIGLL